MPAQWLPLLTISLVIITNNVRITYSECYITKEISEFRMKYPEFNDCLTLTEVDCSKDSSKLSTRDLLNISGEKNGEEKLQFNYLKYSHNPTLALLKTSIHNIWGEKLTVRIQNTKNQLLSSTCHTVDFDGIRNLTMSLVTFVIEMVQTTVEFFIEADGETKFRKYILRLPGLQISKRSEGVFADHIFNYIDTSDPARYRLYIHPLEESYNVTTYNVTIKCTNETVGNFTLSTNKSYYDWETSKGKKGKCYFEIQPVIDVSKCAESQSCITSSANFDLYFYDIPLIVMIVSSASILFAVFVTLRWMYICYARRIWSRRERPNCLLVYASSHKEHIAVMIKLAEYLRACDINAMIDELDAPKENVHNPYIWYHKAFEKATTVIITASPPYTSDWPSPYRFLDKLALKLMQSNLHLNNKDYITVKFPHCKRREDIPLEARSFNNFKLPKDLDKLVEKIQNIDYTKICKIPKDEFLHSLNTAREIICNKKRKTSVVESSKNVDIETFSYKESIEISDYSTDDDEAWLGKKKDEEETEIVEDEEDDDSVLWS